MNTDKEIPDIGFNCPDNMPEEILNDLISELDTKNLNFQVRRLPMPIYNMFEWAVPGIIAAYVLKPYFESFLKEAGKDHYVYLSKWLKSLVKKARKIKVRTIAAPQSEDKLDPTYCQSKSISIYCQTKDNKLIKLLFDETLGDDDWENSIDKIMNLLIEHYTSPNDKLTEDIKSLNPKYKTFYAFIDRDTKEWIIKDDQELVQVRIAASKSESNSE
jgi:hypothetical protein